MNKETDEYFEHLGELESWYFLLRQLAEPETPQPAINRMIDDPAGYADTKLKKRCEDAFEIYENIIRLKKLLGFDDWVETQAGLDEIKEAYQKEFSAETV